MTIHLKTVATLSKSLAVKREKTGEDTEAVVAHLKFGECVIDRDQLDELLGQPIGWSTASLYDDLGAPLARITLALNASNWSASGLVRGGDKIGDPPLKLKDAEIDSIALELAPLGALLSAQLSWMAEGDEVDDIADMLGKIVTFDLVLSNGGQGDLLAPMNRLQTLADRDGTSMTMTDSDGKVLLKVEPRTGDTISSAGEAMKLLQKGWALLGSDPNFKLVSPDSRTVRSVWLNAARSCLKRGLIPAGTDRYIAKSEAA